MSYLVCMLCMLCMYVTMYVCMYFYPTEAILQRVLLEYIYHIPQAIVLMYFLLTYSTFGLPGVLIMGVATVDAYT